jgi:hypothetical protein
MPLMDTVVSIVADAVTYERALHKPHTATPTYRILFLPEGTAHAVDPPDVQGIIPPQPLLQLNTEVAEDARKDSAQRVTGINTGFVLFYFILSNNCSTQFILHFFVIEKK